MSFLVKFVFLSCVLAVTVAKVLTADEKRAMLMGVLATCAAQEGATDVDVQQVVSHAPSTRGALCLNACIMENIGIIKDGKLSIEGGLKLAEMSGDPQKIENSKAVGKECESIVGADRCETALQIMQCTHKAAIARGLDPMRDLN